MPNTGVKIAFSIRNSCTVFIIANNVDTLFTLEAPHGFCFNDYPLSMFCDYAIYFDIHGCQKFNFPNKKFRAKTLASRF